MHKQIALILLCVSSLCAMAQDYVQGTAADKIITISDKTGNTIDAAEKKTFDLFPFYSDAEFVSAQFIKKKDNNNLFLKVTLKNNKIIEEPYTLDHYLRSQALINRKTLKNQALVYADSSVGSNGMRLIILCPNTGEVIDSIEKERFDLFSSYTKREFQSARIYEDKHKELQVEITLKNGTIDKKVFSRSRIDDMVELIADKIPQSAQKNAESPVCTIILNNGEKIEGRVIEKRKETIAFETALEVLTLKISEIAEKKGLY